MRLRPEPSNRFLCLMIWLQVKRNGDVVMYDANQRTETMKIRNLIPARPITTTEAANAQTGANNSPGTEAATGVGEYQLFVNRREEICVMQSSAEVDCGRYIKVYNYHTCQEIYTINLDLWKYGMSRDESICIYTNQVNMVIAF